MPGDSSPPPPPPPHAPPPDAGEPAEIPKAEEPAMDTAREAAAAAAAAAAADEEEALRLLALAESRLAGGHLRSAAKYARRASRRNASLPSASRLLTAARILLADPSDPYASVLLPPSSSFSSARRHFKTLTLTLKTAPPLSSPAAAAAVEEALARASAAFRVLSDRNRRAGGAAATFWTACATCRVLHEFDRKYVGYRLVCPGCSKSFLAVEVPPPSPEAETKKRRSSRTSPPLSPPSKKPRQPRPEKTLAEMQLELTRTKDKKNKGKDGRDRNRDGKEKEKRRKEGALMRTSEKGGNSGLIAVEDSDFYDFDKDRTEKCFKKGQVWAVYDDDDGMPRHYGLVEEVLSSNPFKMRMNWLDLQCHGGGGGGGGGSGNEVLLLLERSGTHVSCGQFKVGRAITVDSVNLFSHLVACERAARELYRVYPKKGSVWALYGERNAGSEEGRKYDIVVSLSSYNEMYGMSMAHLEKVEGYKTIFTRQAIGPHSVRWLEKSDVSLFSHQIPARKVSGAEGPELPGECWELDPASLPPELLSIGWRR